MGPILDAVWVCHFLDFGPFLFLLLFCCWVLFFICLFIYLKLCLFQWFQLSFLLLCPSPSACLNAFWIFNEFNQTTNMRAVLRSHYATLKKYFSHPSLVTYFLCTPPIKPKVGQLIANHMKLVTVSNWPIIMIENLAHFSHKFRTISQIFTTIVLQN